MFYLSSHVTSQGGILCITGSGIIKSQNFTIGRDSLTYEETAFSHKKLVVNCGVLSFHTQKNFFEFCCPNLESELGFDVKTCVLVLGRDVYYLLFNRILEHCQMIYTFEHNQIYLVPLKLT